jgi:hypothetical protein
MSASDQRQVLKLLENAISTSIAVGGISMDLVVVDADGVESIWHWVATEPPADAPRCCGPIARAVQ